MSVEKWGGIMKMIRPIGYSKSKIGTEFSVVLLIIATVIAVLLVKGGAAWKDAKYIIIGGAVLAVIFVLSDITSNFRNSKKIAHMNEMLQAPSVKGEIKEIRRAVYFMGKLRAVDENEHISYKHYVYRIVAVFRDEADGAEKTVISEPYARDPKIFLSGNNVEIHYSADGAYWIEPLDIIGDDTADDNISKKLKVQRNVEKHSNLFTAAVLGVSVLFLVAAYLLIEKFFIGR